MADSYLHPLSLSSDPARSQTATRSQSPARQTSLHVMLAELEMTEAIMFLILDCSRNQRLRFRPTAPSVSDIQALDKRCE